MTKMSKNCKVTIKHTFQENVWNDAFSVVHRFFSTTVAKLLNYEKYSNYGYSYCNKVVREMWLNYIDNDIGSVSTKIQPYLLSDGPIKWCLVRNLPFKSLDLDCSSGWCRLTTNGAKLLAMCCINIVEFRFHEDYRPPGMADEIVIQLGERCKKIKIVNINSKNITDNGIAPIIRCDPNLVKITLTVTDSGGHLFRITVTDSGAGISAENQTKMFGQYVQFNAAALQKGKGSGLGLWISKRK